MGTDGVRVELLDLDALASRGDAAGWETLDASERERAAALRDGTDRRRYVAAHGELRRLLGGVTGLGAGAVVILRAPCSTCGEPHGKPFVDGAPSFSLSRSGGWAAVALSRTPGAEIGVDLEGAQDHARLEPLRDTVLAPGETSHDLLRTWVRKESLLKATGEGLGRAMGEIHADDERVEDLRLPHGLVGAVAVTSESARGTSAGADADVFTTASRWSAKVRRR